MALRQQLMALRAGMYPVTGLRLPVTCGSTIHGNGTYSRLKPEPSCDSGFVPYEPLMDEPLKPSGESAERKRWLMRGRLLYKISKEAAEVRRRRRKIAKLEVREVIRSFLDGDDDDAQLPVFSRHSSGCEAAPDHTCNSSFSRHSSACVATADHTRNSLFSRHSSAREVAADHTCTQNDLDNGQVVQAARDDNSDEEFWSSLPVVDSRTKHLLSVPSIPERSFPGKTIRSRLDAIRVSRETMR